MLEHGGNYRLCSIACILYFKRPSPYQLSLKFQFGLGVRLYVGRGELHVYIVQEDKQKKNLYT